MPGMRGVPAVRGAGNNSDLISNSCTISLFTFTIGSTTGVGRPPAFAPSSAQSSLLLEKFSPNKSSLFFVTAGTGTGAGTGAGVGAHTGVGADMGMDTGMGMNTGVGLTTGFSSLFFRSDF